MALKEKSNQELLKLEFYSDFKRKDNYLSGCNVQN